jgi:ribonuclease HI
VRDAAHRELVAEAVCIGFVTNNAAEYAALINGLARCREFTKGHVRCTSDSELLVRHMNGMYRVRSPDLKPLYLRAKELEGAFAQVIYQHEDRQHPELAAVDELVNAALDACEVTGKHSATAAT